jgi:copper(I)-binding protein
VRRPALTAAAAAVAAAAALAGCSSSSGGGTPKLSVSGAYVPQPPLADMAAGYFTVRNTGGGDDALTSVSTAFASQASLMVTTAAGAMQGTKDLAIPAGGTLRLAVGGDHLMLMGLRGGRPKIGEQVSFELHFAHSAPITVRVPVEPATYRPKD